MTAAHDDYAHLHRWVNQLSRAQVRHLELVSIEDPELPAITKPEAEEDEPVPAERLSWIGIVDSGWRDAAERHDDYIRARFESTEIS